MVQFTWLAMGYEAVAASESRQCTREQAINAETEASTLPTWNAVYLSFKRFAHCDDAAIAEGYSAAVSRLLSYEWKSFLDLVELANADNDFKTFVIAHIDQTTSADDSERIAANVNAHCTSRGKKLCERISARLRELDRQNNPSR